MTGVQSTYSINSLSLHLSFSLSVPLFLIYSCICTHTQTHRHTGLVVILWGEACGSYEQQLCSEADYCILLWILALHPIFINTRSTQGQLTGHKHNNSLQINVLIGYETPAHSISSNPLKGQPSNMGDGQNSSSSSLYICFLLACQQQAGALHHTTFL